MVQRRNHSVERPWTDDSGQSTGRGAADTRVRIAVSRLLQAIDRPDIGDPAQRQSRPGSQGGNVAVKGRDQRLYGRLAYGDEGTLSLIANLPADVTIEERGAPSIGVVPQQGNQEGNGRRRLGAVEFRAGLGSRLSAPIKPADVLADRSRGILGNAPDGGHARSHRVRAAGGHEQAAR